VVARTVGGAVIRNRVRRRLRHLMAPRLARLPAGSRVVVRALPPAAAASGPELATDLDAALDRCLAATPVPTRAPARTLPKRTSS
jgi:ribonuclease P protein component